jgi:hypothetical protein
MTENTAPGRGIPGSGAPDHPFDGIPLPAHGFAVLDQQVQELTSVPASEVIGRAALLLMSASAERLGLVPGQEPDLDMDDARRLITALAGLLAAAADDLGPQREPLLNGLRTLQNAFREASAHPDAPGDGPGEKFLS